MFHTSLSSPYLRITAAICLLLSPAFAVTGRDVALKPRGSVEVLSRRMVPAQVNSPLKSRSTEKPLRYEHDLHYLEGNCCVSLVLHRAHDFLSFHGIAWAGAIRSPVFPSLSTFSACSSQATKGL